MEVYETLLHKVWAKRWWGLEEGEIGGKKIHQFNPIGVSGLLKCPDCGSLYFHHGWIDTGGMGSRVCIGDYVVVGVGGVRVYPAAVFEQLFRKGVEDGSENSSGT